MFWALSSAERIYSSHPISKLIKDIEWRTYSVEELGLVEPEPKLVGVTEVEARPYQPRKHKAVC
jgi:hypothetical protein